MAAVGLVKGAVEGAAWVLSERATCLPDGFDPDRTVLAGREAINFSSYNYLGMSGDPAVTRRMEKFAPVAMILFAVTITFAAFDWIMSLESHWFSTMFGVYFFAMSMVGLVLLSVIGVDPDRPFNFLGIAVGSAVVTRFVDRLRSPAFALGLAEAREKATALGTESLRNLEEFDERAAPLRWIAEYAVNRENE